MYIEWSVYIKQRKCTLKSFKFLYIRFVSSIKIIKDSRFFSEDFQKIVT